MSGNECLNDEVCDESGKNAFAVLCERCNCLVRREKQVSFVATQIELPLSEVKTNANNANKQQIDKESLDEHWYVENIYTLENMGFSNTVNDKVFGL
ncbi:hypothetical protein B4U79_18575 [Dinothrombium tinctorium]|uniref:Uncharacterized protein n=1 Tax=Dinothrombium tinctorium TaxID=1965070 RepID=A0A443QEA5_9ACAR|nr:hypothetical protein B4U79_18575 [Dinothrombium tinctorium]